MEPACVTMATRENTARLTPVSYSYTHAVHMDMTVNVSALQSVQVLLSTFHVLLMLAVVNQALLPLSCVMCVMSTVTSAT